MKTGWYRWFIGCCLVITSSYGAAEPARWQRPSYIEQSFLTIALGSEYNTAPRAIHKWRKPIRVLVTHQVGDQDLHESLLLQHITHLKKITQHDIALTQNAQEANVHVFFTQESKLIPLLKKYTGANTVKNERGSVCIASFRTNSQSEIVEARIFIPVDRARRHAKLLACIVEEITQVMGLPRDDDTVYPSIFNDKSTDTLLTGLDDLLLRILYSPNVKAGMNQTQVTPKVRTAIQALQQKGMIANAALRVRSEGELYQLF
jgi:hypothetical protein